MTLETPKVLVVDDHDLSGFLMHEFLEALGVENTIVTSGADCLEHLTATPDQFDLVLMDIHMPELSGDETTKRIRSMAENPPKEIPVVAVTADSRWSNENLRNDSGLNDYLPKPVSVDDLRKMCAKCGVEASAA